MRSRPILILLLALAASGAAIWVVRTLRRTRHQPNVVLISIDTCRADHLGCYGQPRPTTPYIDAVARDGIRFSNVISPVPLTLPAHSTMLTGTIPPFHGVHDNTNFQLGESSVTLAEHLRDQGYHTAAVIGAVVLNSKSGINQGFATFDDHLASGFNTTGGRLERRAEEVTRIAKKWLDTRPTGPFFLFLHYYDPHDPYLPPEPFASSFANDLYAGEIAYTDHCIGDLLDKLRRLGLYDSSIIIIVGDHGESLGEHGEAEHGYFIYHSTTKVPLIVRLPGRKQGVQIEQTVSLADVVPTVLAQLSLPAPSDVQGEDLSHVLSGDFNGQEQRYIYSESMAATEYGCSPLLGVETGEWKYIQTTNPELYHLAVDPDEMHNLMGEHPEQASFLKERLRSILDEHRFGDPNDAQTVLDPRRLEQLRALGYTGGAVETTFEFDTGKEDPKDFLEIHSKIERMKHRMYQGDLTTARRLGEEVLAVRPDVMSARRNLARIAIEQGDADQAISHYRQMLRLEADSLDAAAWHNNLVVLLLEKGLLDEAVEHGYEAVGLVQRGTETSTVKGRATSITRGTDYLAYSAHLNLAKALLGKGIHREALSEAQTALRVDPQSASAHYLHGTILAELGRVDEAVEAYQKALQVEPGHTEASSALRAIRNATEQSQTP